MRELTQNEALTEALTSALNSDKRVVAFECTLETEAPSQTWQTLLANQSPEKVKSISGYAHSVLGTALGAAMAGLKPIVRLHSPAQLLSSYSFLAATMGRIPNFTGRNLDAPLVLIVPTGPGLQLGIQHDLAIEAILTNIPDIIVTSASGAYDIKGLLLSALPEERPFVILESPLLRNSKENVPENDYLINLEEAPTLRTGSDLTLLTWGHNLKRAIRIADELENSNIKSDVINVRALNPLKIKNLAESIQKTHRVVIIDDGPKQGSFGTQLSAMLQEEFFSQLNHAILKFSFWDETPNYLPHLEEYSQAFTERCIAKIRGSIEAETI